MNATSTARASAEAPPTRVQPRGAASAEIAGSSPGPEISFEEAIPLDVEARQALIAIAAYYRAERRGFISGGELDDWLAAEAEIAQQFRAQRNEQRSDTSRTSPV